jgi:hypothetical protein
LGEPLGHQADGPWPYDGHYVSKLNLTPVHGVEAPISHVNQRAFIERNGVSSLWMLLMALQHFKVTHKDVKSKTFKNYKLNYPFKTSQPHKPITPSYLELVKLRDTLNLKPIYKPQINK